MKILYLAAYFKPEVVSSSQMESDLLNAFAENGIKVQILCPVPTRNCSVELQKKYKKIKTEEMFGGNVCIKRYWAPKERNSTALKFLRYLWCNLIEILISRKFKDIDVIYADSTPPTHGLVGGYLSKKLSKKGRQISFVYDLQDIFPDSLVTTGITREGSVLWKIGRKAEDYGYKNAKKIITISKKCRENIEKKGVLSDKIAVIPNWIDLDAVKPVAKAANPLFDEYGIDRNKFIVLYAGNIGESQGADIILDCALEYEDNENIEFVVFGTGVLFDDFKKSAESIKNVKVFEVLPPDKISFVYSLADISLVICKKGVGAAGMPSKVLSIMACNAPIVASFDTDSDLSELLEKSGAGVCVEPENTELLKKEIDKKYNEWRSCKMAEFNSRDYVKRNLSKEICTPKYLEEISGLVNK